MGNRLRLSVSAVAMLLGVMWLATTHPAADQQPPSPAASAGQGRPAASTAKPYRAPRTPDGKPDLQGFWSNATYTPLERAQNVTKEFYTPEEFEKLKKDAIARDETQTKPGTTADVHYDFTQFGLDKSQHTIVQNLRTSQIIDPPDGRIPPVTAEAQKRAAAQAEDRPPQSAQYDQVQNMPQGSRCIIMGVAGPPMRDAGYNSTYHIRSEEHTSEL